LVSSLDLLDVSSFFTLCQIKRFAESSGTHEFLQFDKCLF
jgi:hypothetical protein